MFNNDEKKLDKMKKGYRSISVPDSIDSYINSGINKGKKHSRSKKMRIIAGYSASFLIVLMLIFIRVSPAFAEMMSNIPGIEYIVKLINYDKGLKLAVENDFSQHIGVSDEHEDIVFTVEDIIVDESQMILFYSIENKGNFENVRLSSINFLNKKGDSLKVSCGWSPKGDKDIFDGKQVGKISVNFSSEDQIPDELTVEAKLSKLISGKKINDDDYGQEDSGQKQDENKLASTWEVKVPIDKEKFKNLKEIYRINQEVMFDDQKVYFKQLTLYPTRVVLDVEYDENNTKKIFGFENLRIIDENTEWGGVSNGITAKYPSENSMKLYLESSYFTKPKSIYIAVEGIRALEKEKLDIKIDLEKGKILNPPDDKLKILEIRNNEYINIVFEMEKCDTIKSSVMFRSEFKDIDGNEYISPRIGYTTIDESKILLHYSIKADESYKNPIILKFGNYPLFIKESIKIKVK